METLEDFNLPSQESKDSKTDFVFKDDLPEYIRPKLKSDDFDLYGGLYSPLLMSKMKSWIKKNQFFAVVEYKNGFAPGF